MKKNLSIFFVLLAFNASIYAQSKAEKAVALAVENLRQAMVSGDKTALTNIAMAELTYGHSGGKVENKAEFVEAIATGKSDFVKIDLSEQTISVVGKTAIVRHKLFAETNDAGKGPGTVKLAILTVWQKQSGQWKLLARQAVKQP